MPLPSRRAAAAGAGARAPGRPRPAAPPGATLRGGGAGARGGRGPRGASRSRRRGGGLRAALRDPAEAERVLERGAEYWRTEEAVDSWVAQRAGQRTPEQELLLSLGTEVSRAVGRSQPGGRGEG